ncbi:MAG: hypothetical protein R2705_06905 [Ilumatobacteraceae bacterium]
MIGGRAGRAGDYWRLAQAGRSVVLLDAGRDAAPGGVAVGSAGFIVPSLIAPLAAGCDR